MSEAVSPSDLARAAAEDLHPALLCKHAWGFRQVRRPSLGLLTDGAVCWKVFIHLFPLCLWGAARGHSFGSEDLQRDFGEEGAGPGAWAP